MSTTDQHKLYGRRAILNDLGVELVNREFHATSKRNQLYEAAKVAVEEENFTVAEVARLAGLTRQTIYNILKKEEK